MLVIVFIRKIIVMYGPEISCPSHFVNQLPGIHHFLAGRYVYRYTSLLSLLVLKRYAKHQICNMQHTCICDVTTPERKKNKNTKHSMHAQSWQRSKTQNNKTRRLNGYLKMGAMSVCIDAWTPVRYTPAKWRTKPVAISIISTLRRCRAHLEAYIAYMRR